MYEIYKFLLKKYFF